LYSDLQECHLLRLIKSFPARDKTKENLLKSAEFQFKLSDSFNIPVVKNKLEILSKYFEIQQKMSENKN